MMKRWCLAVTASLGGLALLGMSVRAGETTAPDAARGEKALLARSFTPPSLSLQAYQNAWKTWGEDLNEQPPDYARRFRERYGLHEAPYPNNGYPMGIREANGLLGKALANDCLICHGGSILGKSYIGLANSTIDYQAFVEELASAEGRPNKAPFVFSRVRGTTEAGGITVFLFGLREPDLKLRTTPLDLDMHDDMCEDPPAWWLLKKKKTMYHTGGADARSVRSLMQFMLTPLNSAAIFDREEATFADIRAYLVSLQPPKYPLPVDAELAGKGKELFEATCARCHGTYGAQWTYPNKIVPLAEIGTDPARFRGISAKFVENYNKSWFAHERGASGEEFPAKETEGYQAPPLDGVWATAPYFHNGSVPTVYHVLNSKARPKLFTRSFRTDAEAFDSEKLGWKVKVLEQGPDAMLPGIERRKVYDTTQPGRGNSGHPFGDKLSDAERMAVIEYLKTL
jgi:mono/diheme cytochrome c family protein